MPAIDRTATFPLALDGSALLAEGTVAVATTGVIWATALSVTNTNYLIRFLPHPLPAVSLAAAY